MKCSIEGLGNDKNVVTKQAASKLPTPRTHRARRQTGCRKLFSKLRRSGAQEEMTRSVEATVFFERIMLRERLSEGLSSLVSSLC